jgi:citrate lyase subunit beta/citryl-CoA lyase
MQLDGARSVLFVPGTRPDRFGKALTSGADAVVIDLEDAVAPEHKSDARQHVVDWLTARPARAAVRINGLGSPEHDADVEALAFCSPLAAVLPKAELIGDLRALHERLPDTPLLPLVETAAGLLAAATLARGPGVVRLALGSVDLQLDLDLADEDVRSSGTPFMTARFWLATVSRAAGIAAPLDGVRHRCRGP